MKIIINTTNLKMGGAIQIAHSFLNELKNIKNNNEYYIFLSPQLNKQINKEDFPKNFFFFLFNNLSPLLFFNKGIKKLKTQEKKINPDIVFSLFGPTYWMPNSKHVVGFAKGKYIYEDLPFFSKLNFIEKIKHKFLKKYHKYIFEKSASFYITETESVKSRLLKYLKIKEKQVFVVSNTYNSVFNIVKKQKSNSDIFKFLTVSSYYSHKNLEILNDVVNYLRKNAPKIKIQFTLTIPNNIFNEIFKNNRDYIKNIGNIDIEKLPNIYNNYDAVILPTLVESFTASYPEAMIMNLPILTSDLPFAHEICGDAALYFNPIDAKDIANKIIHLYENTELQKKLIENGVKQVKSFPTAKERAEMYLNICEKIVNGEI